MKRKLIQVFLICMQMVLNSHTISPAVLVMTFNILHSLYAYHFIKDY